MEIYFEVEGERFPYKPEEGPDKKTQSIVNDLVAKKEVRNLDNLDYEIGK